MVDLNEMYKRQRIIADKLSIILVTCGKCGGIILAKRGDFVEEGDSGILQFAHNSFVGNNSTGHHCPYCGFCSDVCDFPDFFNEPENYE